MARFVENELFVIFWHRTTAKPELIYGAEVNLNRFTGDFGHLILPDYDLAKTVCIALLDDKGKPVSTSNSGFMTNWKRPFVATEVGEVLPHWEIGVYLLNGERKSDRHHGAEKHRNNHCATAWRHRHRKLVDLEGPWAPSAVGSSENRFCQQRFARVENASHFDSNVFGVASQ